MVVVNKLNKENFLNPKNDIVFKIFFAAAKNKVLLISFLESILDPAKTIEDVEILNPTLPKDAYKDKGIVLDIVVKFKDQTRVDVEMQVEYTTGFRKRILYYWSKLHQSQLQFGELYPKLAPTISIAVLAYNEFENSPDEVHSIFELRERSRGELYLPDMQLHFLELQKYGLWKKKYQQKHPLLDHWIQFFKINDLSEAEMLKLLEEPIMGKALKALEEMSNDPANKELAEMREKARVNLLIITSEAKAEGIAEGEAKGKAEGEAKGKAEGILKMAKKGFDAKEIASIFDMTIEEIQNILKA